MFFLNLQRLKNDREYLNLLSYGLLILEIILILEMYTKKLYINKTDIVFLSILILLISNTVIVINLFRIKYKYRLKLKSHDKKYYLFLFNTDKLKKDKEYLKLSLFLAVALEFLLIMFKYKSKANVNTILYMKDLLIIAINSISLIYICTIWKIHHTKK